ncbi:MAG: T9SS type A sorting domain-containing protein [bacterium]|nr:T9SS type A sorting domain-containing protein [bacterium]
MKKLFIVWFIIFHFIESKSQTWCPPGATWHYYKYYSFLGVVYRDGVIELKYTDTVSVNGILCKVVKGTYYGASAGLAPASPTIVINNYVVLKTYELNKVIRVYSDARGNFDTLANFYARIGDSWLFSGDFGTNCSAMQRRKLTVMDSVFVVLNGQTLRKLTLKVNNDTSQKYVMIEKIGGVQCKFFSGSSFLYAEDFCAAKDDPGLGGDFLCYEDNQFPIYKLSPGTNCNYNGVGISKYSLSSPVNPYPNPSNGLFTFLIAEPAELRVMDTGGREVLRVLAMGNEKQILDLRSLSDGLYIVKVTTSSGCNYSKLVKAQN